MITAYGAAYCSIKRSIPMTEHEAKSLAKETHLFGYEPNVIHYNGHWYLQIRGDGSDDRMVSFQLEKMRKYHA